MTTNARPTPLQYMAYSYGRTLPDAMRNWVAHDLAGRGAVRRHVLRMRPYPQPSFSRRSGCFPRRCTCISR